MYIRDAKNREEVWLLDRLDEFGFEDPAFRSRDYVLAIDEDTGTKTGFGRLRVHSLGEDESACEFTCIGVRPDHRGQGVGAHILERLVEMARDQGFETVVAFTDVVDYCAQFGFDRVPPGDLHAKLDERLGAVRDWSPEADPVRIAVDDFEMPPRLRRRFPDDVEEPDPEERPEDFGIDPDTASYKYDTGRSTDP